MVQIYVALPDEEVTVWRPVDAERLHGDVYRILDQEYDTAIESWQFEPGDVVECERIQASNGTILVAKGRV